MKSLKFRLLFTVIFSSAVLVSESSNAAVRVRTVPATAVQKKKDATHSVAPKPQPAISSKNDMGFFCSEKGNMKTRLAVIDSGVPK